MRNTFLYVGIALVLAVLAVTALGDLPALDAIGLNPGLLATFTPESVTITPTVVPTATPSPTAVPDLWNNLAFEFEKVILKDTGSTEESRIWLMQLKVVAVEIAYQVNPAKSETYHIISGEFGGGKYDIGSVDFYDVLAKEFASLGPQALAVALPEVSRTVEFSELTDASWLTSNATGSYQLYIQIQYLVPEGGSTGYLITANEDLAKSLFTESADGTLHAFELDGTRYYETSALVALSLHPANDRLYVRWFQDPSTPFEADETMKILLEYPDGTYAITDWPDSYGDVVWEDVSKLSSGKGRRMYVTLRHLISNK